MMHLPQSLTDAASPKNVSYCIFAVMVNNNNNNMHTDKDKHKLYPIPVLTLTEALCPAAPADKPVGMAKVQCVTTDQSYAVRPLNYREEEAEAQRTMTWSRSQS